MANQPTAGNIKRLGRREHAKASEAYEDVEFRYPHNGNAVWRGSVPVVYRRAGLDCKTEDEVAKVIAQAYMAMQPANARFWLASQTEHWSHRQADVTKGFFDVLVDGKWKCRQCDLPANPNFARRIQDLKEMGYVLSTDQSRLCSRCGKRGTHLQMLWLPRGDPHGYETFSARLRARILKALDGLDAYENHTHSKHLLPDHKFPEIRWDAQTCAENPDDMPDDAIRQKFQLLNNQRNQQKREACRSCFQSRKRAYPFGIKFFYAGDENWPRGVPASGAAAERGCHGCGWYDLAGWRIALNGRLKAR